MKNVSGKTVLLTGASGGLGTFMARAFAKAGAKLALIASPGAGLDAIREECQTLGATAMSMVADLRDPPQRHEAVERVESQFGSIDILVNNAGVEFTAPYHELSESDINSVLAVNLDAPMVLTRLVLPGMLKNRCGHIVNISSLAGKSGPAYQESYAATKAALVAFTTSLRASYRSSGVSASVIVPGFVEAGIYARLKENSGCSAPGILGTSQPEKVAGAVLRAIHQDRLEIIINPMPVRPLLAFASLFPSLGEWLIEKIGSNEFFRRVVQATHARKNDLAPLAQNRTNQIKNMETKLKLLTTVAFGGSIATASATGFRLPDQDAFATARGEAFIATADNPSAIYYNPAGITQLEGSNFRGGVYGLYLHNTYASPTTGQKFDNEKDLHAVPQFFYTYTPKDFPLSFGLGAYAPFGLSSEWPDDTGFRTLGTEAELMYYTINPVVAWKISETFSIAAGFRASYSEVDLRQGIFWPAQPFDEFRFKGDGWAFGYNLGLLWKVHEKVSFGASFRSVTSVDFDGHTDAHNDVPIPPVGIPAFSYRSDASAELDFPLSAAVGISYRPTPSWNLEFNADYNGWDRLNTLTVKQQSSIVLPQDVAVPLNWESSWYYEFGATRYLANGWSVSGGYIFNENSLPSENYTPLVADQDRHFFSIGTGFKGDRFSFDAGYQFGYGPERTVTGSAPSAAGQTADGKYKFLSHAVSLTAGWRF